MTPWTPESVLGVTRAFMESRIVLTGVELDLFTLLSGSPKSVEEVAETLLLAQRGTTILLDALTAMGLLEKKDDCYLCPDAIANILSADSPTTVLPMARHMVGLWRRWSDLTNIVQYGMPDAPAEIFEKETDLAAFIGAMHVVGRHAADAIAEQAEADASRKMLDVGGATGTYAEAFLRKYPAMCATVFDRPAVIELARKRLAGSDVKDRITLATGDFYTDENSPEQNLDLFQRVFRALIPRGRILIRDHVMSEDRTEPRAGALFAVNMLTATSGGNCYTFDEIRESLDAAGFIQVRLVQSGEMMDALVEAFKP